MNHLKIRSMGGKCVSYKSPADKRNQNDWISYCAGWVFFLTNFTSGNRLNVSTELVVSSSYILVNFKPALRYFR